MTEFYRKTIFYKSAIAMCGLLVAIQVLTELSDILAGISEEVLHELTTLGWWLFIARTACKLLLISLVTIKAFIDPTVHNLKASIQPTTTP